MSSATAMPAHRVGLQPANVTQSLVYSPLRQSYTDQGREILPFASRLSSPMKFAGDPEARKLQSRVSHQSRSARFRFRPIKPGERRAPVFRFKPPESTFATTRILSPWVSITKGDYLDPRFRNADQEFEFRYVPSTLSGAGSLGDQDIGVRSMSSQPESGAAPPLDSPIGKAPSSQSGDHVMEATNTSTRDGSVNSARNSSRRSLQKRVTIRSPTTGSVSEPTPRPDDGLLLKSEPKLSGQNANYYSGYLPPELSDQIAERLNLGKSGESVSSASKDDMSALNRHYGQDYKPLIGDRSAMYHSFPVARRISDIEKARVEGRRRLMKSRGIFPGHFSGLDSRAPLQRTRAPGVNLNEALRQQQRMSKSAVADPTSRIVKNKSSVEEFDRQMNRTFEKQAIMREMLKK